MDVAAALGIPQGEHALTMLCLRALSLRKGRALKSLCVACQQEERYDPIVPIQLRKMPVKPKRIRILSHEADAES